MNNATTSCPHCGRAVNAAARVCPFCGGEAVRAVPRSAPSCPRCRSPLEPYVFRGAALDRCPGCQGLWLDGDEFARLSSERDAFKDDSVPYRYQRKPLPAVEGYLPCARCGRPMVRLNFKRVSGVMIDFCRDCGYWLDAGELEQLRAFVASGGTDRLHEREIEQNRQEIERVSGRVDDLEFREQVVHATDILYWITRIFF